MNELNHLAIIMDGNGRWAKKRGFIRTRGHEKGANVVEDIAEFCIGNNISYLTLYAFSTENWKRPKTEVDFLISLFKKFLKDKESLLLREKIKFQTIGDINAFDDELLDLIKDLKEKTKEFDSLTLNLAVNYGSKDEILRAVKKLVDENLEINEANLTAHLDSSIPVDLLIRTGGEQRLSNFLLWQASYAELCFTQTLWPDFTKEELGEIVQKYRKIDRKFGGL
ncbi:MAG: di-trans,poly-cis-decaprenylcistransferase [Campylobacteraceae bacterium]|nr:di-trans,poly-cis-decaprenylcistransferase [Campylobacteraceae bacterium]